MTELRQRVIQDMQLHGLMQGTQDVYVRAVRELAAHYRLSPDQLTEEQVRQFFVHLSQERKLAANSVQTRLYAIKFLYRRTLQRNWKLFDLLRIRPKHKLPTVLSRQEVQQLLGAVRRPAARISLMMMYACGLRVTAQQKEKLVKMRTTNPADPKGPFLYSSPISAPNIENTDFLFGVRPNANVPSTPPGTPGK